MSLHKYFRKETLFPLRVCVAIYLSPRTPVTSPFPLDPDFAYSSQTVCTYCTYCFFLSILTWHTLFCPCAHPLLPFLSISLFMYLVLFLIFPVILPCHLIALYFFGPYVQDHFVIINFDVQKRLGVRHVVRRSHHASSRQY